MERLNEMGRFPKFETKVKVTLSCTENLSAKKRMRKESEGYTFDS
jgi:hypothetical protein